ncbi:hypothetical protein [Enterovibrio norvegicus]|uniref:hypothetical protein n=1 Tax=Enterovibrio norvegicus TaxID=188144 RepID=UPI0024B1B367|nr:hypothetical protein [Enterovibrio norvegicus]
MNPLHHPKRLALLQLNALKDSVMLEYGDSQADTILNNYFRLMTEVSSAEDENTLNLITLNDAALLAT